MRKLLKNQSSGFTLIEILVVIGIIAVLAAIVIIAINPARQFAQARNTQRTSDASAISNAIGQYFADNKGSLPGAIGTTSVEIKKAAGGSDICSVLVPTYMAALPVDPNTTSAGLSKGEAITDCTANYTTGYYVSKDTSSNARVTVVANDTEIPPATVDISITR